MSGGSWDYFYHKLNDVKDQLLESNDPLRRALSKQVGLLSKAMHDIECVDSGDLAAGDEVAAIRATLGSKADRLTISELITEGKSLLKKIDSTGGALEALLLKAEGAIDE